MLFQFYRYVNYAITDLYNFYRFFYESTRLHYAVRVLYVS